MDDEAGRRRPVDRGTDELLEQAARYVSAVRSARGAAGRARAALHRPGLTALAVLLRSLPTVEAQFSDSAAGRELRSWFGPGRLLPLDRVPVAVLTLPPTSTEYLRGRSRQALRTNLARAARSGIACRNVTDMADLHRICGQIAEVRRTMPDVYLAPHVRPGPHSVLSAAFDAAGTPLALSHLVVDGAWAGIGFKVAVIDRDEAHLARYALQAQMAGILIDRGVEKLTVGGSMLLSTPGTRYFQARTGFEPVLVRLRPAPGPARKPAPGCLPHADVSRPVPAAPAVPGRPQLAARSGAGSGPQRPTGGAPAAYPRQGQTIGCHPGS